MEEVFWVSCSETQMLQNSDATGHSASGPGSKSCAGVNKERAPCEEEISKMYFSCSSFLLVLTFFTSQHAHRERYLIQHRHTLSEVSRLLGLTVPHSGVLHAVALHAGAPFRPHCTWEVGEDAHLQSSLSGLTILYYHGAGNETVALNHKPPDPLGTRGGPLWKEPQPQGPGLILNIDCPVVSKVRLPSNPSVTTTDELSFLIFIKNVDVA